MAIFFHNLTKSVFNTSDIGDFMGCVDQDDLIRWTESGCAILRPLSEMTCPYTIDQFKETYKEVHGEDFKQITL